MLEYIQVKLNTPDDFKSALECRDTNLIPDDHSYLCYEISMNDYVYSTNTGEYDVLVNTFEEFKHAIFLVHLGVPIDKVLEVLHGKYPVYNLSS